MVTQVIGDNVARAFSLVGALSIVRFCILPFRDIPDTAYVIFAVIIGMAVGAGLFGLPRWIAVIGCASVFMRTAKSWLSAHSPFPPSRPLSARHRRLFRHIFPGLFSCPELVSIFDHSPGCCQRVHLRNPTQARHPARRLRPQNLHHGRHSTAGLRRGKFEESLNRPVLACTPLVSGTFSSESEIARLERESRRSSLTCPRNTATCADARLRPAMTGRAPGRTPAAHLRAFAEISSHVGLQPHSHLLGIEISPNTRHQ